MGGCLPPEGECAYIAAKARALALCTPADQRPCAWSLAPPYIVAKAMRPCTLRASGPRPLYLPPLAPLSDAYLPPAGTRAVTYNQDSLCPTHGGHKYKDCTLINTNGTFKSSGPAATTAKERLDGAYIPAVGHSYINEPRNSGKSASDLRKHAISE